MNTKIITALLAVIFLTSSSMVNGAIVEYTNYKLDSTITIDGAMDDWADISPASLTLKPARTTADDNASYAAEFYSTHDTNKIYFLVVIKNDQFHWFNFDTGISHHHAPAIALAFPIDANAKVQYMGGTDRDTVANLETPSGEVDIMHWEMEVDHGVATSGTKNTTAGASFGDGTKNLDDEWAITKENRNDDNDAATSENSYKGAWSFTGGYDANGTVGDWIFEISRDLDTGDIHDAAFAEDQTIDVAVAFWTPNEHTNKKWSEDGHYVNYDNVIEMTLSGDTGPKNEDSPGFGVFLAFSGIFGMAVVLKKRR